MASRLAIFGGSRMAASRPERRKAFARAVFAGSPHNQAARSAGYHGSLRRLSKTASRLMKHPDVIGELGRMGNHARVQAIAERNETLEFLTRQLRFNPLGVLNARGEIDLQRATESGMAELLEGIDVWERKTPAGNTIRRIRVRFPDRGAAIDRMAKMLGWNQPEQHEVSHTAVLKAALVGLTDEELKA
jgi:hypothetical protein